jgi:hypothetical protein
MNELHKTLICTQCRRLAINKIFILTEIIIWLVYHQLYCRPKLQWDSPWNTHKFRFSYQYICVNHQMFRTIVSWSRADNKLTLIKTSRSELFKN